MDRHHQNTLYASMKFSKKKINFFKPRKMKEASNKKIKCLRISLAAVKLSQLARTKPQ